MSDRVDDEELVDEGRMNEHCKRLIPNIIIFALRCSSFWDNMACLPEPRVITDARA